MIRPGGPEGRELRETTARAIRGDRVCIVLLSGIGDVVHGLPVALALKRDRPSRKIVWVAQPIPAQVLEHHPAVDEVIVFRPERGLRGVYDLWGSVSNAARSTGSASLSPGGESSPRLGRSSVGGGSSFDTI